MRTQALAVLTDSAPHWKQEGCGLSFQLPDEPGFKRIDFAIILDKAFDVLSVDLFSSSSS